MNIIKIGAFALITMLSLSSFSNAATRLFYENFDDQSNDFDHVGRTYGAGEEGDHSIVNENYDGQAGYCSRINYMANGTGLLDQWEDVGESTTGEHYISYWYRLDSTYGLRGYYSHKDMRFWHSGDTNMDDIVMEKHIYGGSDEYPMDIGPQVDSVLTEGSRTGFSSEPDHASEFTADVFAWHHVEVYLKYDNPAGSGNGEMKVWINDVEQVSLTNIQINKSGYPSYTRFSIPSNATMTNTVGTNHYFVDEVEIWDGMSDAVPSPDPTPGETVPPPDPTPGETGSAIFTETWDSGTTSSWDSAHSSLVVVYDNGYTLTRTHVQDTTSTGSVDKGFGDNGVNGFQTLNSRRIDDATVETDVKFSINSFPSDSSTKVMILESWPGTSYPSTANKDFQAIVEVTGQRQFVVTIKREDWNFYTRYQMNPTTIQADTVYNLKLRIKLDAPYTASNGVLQFWVNDVLQIDNSTEDFILSSRGSDLPKGLNMLMLTGFTGGSGSPDNKTQYWDNIVLSTSTTTDTTILSAPSNFISATP